VTEKLLTALFPTRNRLDILAGQLKLFRHVSYPVVIVDLSDPESQARVRRLVPEGMEYQAHAPDLTFYDKLEAALRGIDTPFVMVMPDRKITFPHAVEALLAHLVAHDDHFAAIGYILGFAVDGSEIDINRVIWFTPTIDNQDPMQRVYHLMRRYQCRTFGMFRTAALLRAVSLARTMRGAIFQEIALMNAIALQGKMARLPVILSLQTEQRSFHPPTRNDPFYWFLDDIGSFFQHYLSYREGLKRFALDLGVCIPSVADLDQLLDMIHAVWLHSNFKGGTLNHAARLLLGDQMPPISQPSNARRRKRLSEGDAVQEGIRRYVWRREVLRAEPRHEIQISAHEMSRVAEQLDIYFHAVLRHNTVLMPDSRKARFRSSKPGAAFDGLRTESSPPIADQLPAAVPEPDVYHLGDDGD
jgi:glycosyltransferase domain-containing protein